MLKKLKSNQFQRRKRIFHTNKPKNLLAFAILLLFCAIAIKIINVFIPKPKLLSLPVPTLPQIMTTSPLSLSPFSNSILGAQIFNPIDIVESVNIERQKTGAKPLRLHAALMKAAQKRVDVIMKYQNFSHYDPYEKIELATVFPMFGYNYIYASENIGMGGTSGPDFVNGFMHSTSHRENLLNPTLMDTGVAVATGPYHQWYVNVVVQLFAIPAGHDEYLGYTSKDREMYRKLLSDVRARLDPLDWIIGQTFQSNKYSKEYKRDLERQNQILEIIYTQMRNENPLASEHVALIMEFNQLTES